MIDFTMPPQFAGDALVVAKPTEQSHRQGVAAFASRSRSARSG